MRNLFGLLLVGAAAVALSAEPGQTAQSTFSINITTDKSVVKAGSDVWIKIQLVNHSNHNIDCSSAYVNGVDRRYQVDVRNDVGTSMKKNSEHPELMPGSIQLCTLKPGESTTARDSRISWLHDLTRPGKYAIQVSRTASDDERDGVVKSNTITLTITQ